MLDTEVNPLTVKRSSVARSRAQMTVEESKCKSEPNSFVIGRGRKILKVQ